MLALIDGDPLCYIAGFAAQKSIHTVQMGEVEIPFTDIELAREFASKHNGEFIKASRVEAEPLAHALQICKRHIQKCLDALHTTEYRVFLTGGSNFREEIATLVPYKGLRWGPEKREQVREQGQWLEWLEETDHLPPASPKPVHYQELKQYLIDHHNAITVEGAEADDACSVLSWQEWNKYKGLRLPLTCCCTIDKDLRMVPGLHFDYSKNQFNWVSEIEGQRSFWTQMITGDKTDNIVGLSESGGKRRTFKTDPIQKMEDPLEMYLYVRQGYEEKYGDNWEAAMTENGRLLHMRKEKGELWTLPISE